ncbi:hypothetical protein ACFY2K_42585 [Kitasatospora sp. NPDC001309]|uniref:hypothetical protein n=1 Tax=Kitasatospora sp. NPDC001309 TaxID=3364013 RepID=UPI0036844875
MTVTYTGLCTRKCDDDDDCSTCPARPTATMTCDRGCGAAFHGRPGEADSSFRQRAGWHFCRPTPYHQTDVCPNCPPHEHY